MPKGYSQKSLIEAVTAVRQGLSFRKASAKFGVPVMTIQNRVSGLIDDHASAGKPTVIPAEIEKQIVEKIKRAADRAVIRGALVRKWMREVKQTYEKEFSELEKSNIWQVEWSSEFPCKPKIVRSSSKKTEKGIDKQTNSKRSSANNLKSSKVIPETNVSVRRTDGKVLSDVIPNKCHQDVQITISDGLKIVDKPVAVTEERQCHSVEIQTSFIDVFSQRDTDNINNDPSRSDGLDNDVKLNQEDNILDDLDVSWKDRVEPFIKDNFANCGNHVLLDSPRKVETQVDNKPKTVKPDIDELHLDLDLGEESNDTHRSQVSTQRSSKKSALEEDSKQIDVYQQRNSGLKVPDRSVNTERSHNSETTSRSKNIDDLEKISPRSNERDSRSLEVKTTTGDDGLSCDNYDKSSSRKQGQRSDRSGEKGQRSNRSEQGSPRSYKSQYSNSKMSENLGQRKKYDEVPTSARPDRLGDVNEWSHASERSKSHRSESSEGRISQRSERSVHSESQRSRSAHSEGHLSDRSHGSPHSEGQRSGRKDQHEKVNPTRSRASPVAFESIRQGRAPLQDSTSLTNVTSVWDSFNSVRDSHEVNLPSTLHQDADKLRELRKNISMELLWVQQAIDSRKNYLRLKGKM